MTEKYERLENKKINEISQKYRLKGYSVVINPKSEDLPIFLQGFNPDIYAFNNEENVIIEVKSKESLTKSKNIEKLSTVLANQPSWRFELILTNPKNKKTLESERILISELEIRQRITKIEILNKNENYEAAFLLGWATLEAVLRDKSKNENLPKDLSITSLVKTIYSLGLLEKKQYSSLIHLLEIRNSISHGYIYPITQLTVSELLNEISLILSPKKYTKNTIVIFGDQSYYFGEKIRFSGTFTGHSRLIFLYLTNKNNPSIGYKLDEVSVPIKDNYPDTFTKVPVKADNTWNFIWDTTNIGKNLPDGEYLIYSTPKPLSVSNIDDKEHSFVQFFLKKPFISASLNKAILSVNDQLLISGTATGNPPSVYIWIFGGNNNLSRFQVPVSNDSSFVFQIKFDPNKKIISKQCYIVIQHPMMNRIPDVISDGKNIFGIWSGSEKYDIEKLQPYEVAEKLIILLNNPKCDDAYCKLSFSIEK